ncbi:transcription termination factor MTERF2, chloroplastic [Vicia villosa]|uniref:transcription termination factor MTERF2, chloroplastic n=1 Tax=Vicia villosa TaxID=3911 RepID=UPI00273BCD12|nr:transcription termination factor MTERF2, chloroplastic [Vicia villosa]
MLLRILPQFPYAAAFPNNIHRRFPVNNYYFPNFTKPPKSHFKIHYYYYDHKTITNSQQLCRSGLGDSALSDSELQEACMAVSSFLQQMGVSLEDSDSIASNSPSYLNMLVEGVRDLEQLSSMSSILDDADNGIFDLNFSYRDKILHIAALKGDNGKLAFFESLGFTLSSSMNLATYISSSSSSSAAHTLPSLINKVASIKQLLFPPNPHNNTTQFLINNIRLFMRNLSISYLDEDLQHTFSFFQKLQAKRGGLNILASQHDAFRCFVETFPRVLLLSVNNHLSPMLNFLRDIGIPADSIPNIVLAFPPILLWNLQLLQTRVKALNQIDGVDKDYAKLMLKYPWVLSASIQKNYKEVLAFLYSLKVPKTRIDRAIKRQPQLLGCSTSKMKLMVDQFDELGVQSKKLDHVITKSPQLLLQKPEDFLQVVLFFENMGFDKEDIGRLLARCPEIFATSISNTLQRKIDFLSRICISQAYLPAVIKKYPELLVSDIDRTLPQRIVYLMKLGLSKKEVAYMVRTFSPLLGYSINEVLQPKIEFLVNTMKRPLRDVVGYPRYFSYSLEKKIKPRYWVLKGRNIECSLKDMLAKNDEEFADEFMGVGTLSSHDRL